MKASRIAVLALAIAGLAPAAFSLDPPHNALWSIRCASCHQTHSAPGGTITKVRGNANLCMSCHTSGGTAAAFPFSSGDQGVPGPGLPVGVSPAGTSHRWDSGASGRVSAVAGNTSTGQVQSGGAYTGVYPKAYTLTITTAGNVGTARFGWSATTPPGGVGANLLTGTSVALDQGITVTFTNGLGTSFALNDRWYVYVRPDISQPASGAMAARIESGKSMCSTCHDQHSQAREPFDPAAPAYAGAGSGAGRHFQRIANDTNQMCTDCHTARNVTSSISGSHPVGVSRSGGEYQNPTTLPLDKTLGRVRCSTCHDVHYAAKTDGSLLRKASTTSVCTECHTLADTVNPGSHFVTTNASTLWPAGQYGSLFPAVTGAANQGSCGNCHQAHGWPDAANTTAHYPYLAVDREENLCYTCHDGSPVTANVRAQFLKASNHPVSTTPSVHVPHESTAAQFSGANRHVECADCHNMHKARPTKHTAGTNAIAATSPLVGVSGASYSNSATNWTLGTLAFVPDTTGASFEYQICLKCHSSWAFGSTPPTGPSGKVETDQALEFNTTNASYHPVFGALPATDPGANGSSRLTAAQLTGGWTSGQTMYCSDCHGNDAAAPAAQGPHGSAVTFILRASRNASYTSWGQPFTGTTPTLTNNWQTSFCRNCHPLNEDTNWSGNRPHTEHDTRTAVKGCYNCHILVPHGGKMSRLIGDNDGTMPTRYAYNGVLTNMFVRSFTKNANPGNYSKSNCQSGSTGCTTHNMAASENW